MNGNAAISVPALSGRRTRIASVGIAVFLLAAPLAAPAIAEKGDGEAHRAPYTGVDTWYAFGPNIDEHTIVSFTDAAVSRGLRAAGYRYVWIDAGWWNGSRDANGSIVVDRDKWPHGMSWLAAYIHSHGLLAGIYTDLGPVGCANAGSYGHYQQDVDTFAAWGFDAIKVDDCGGNQLRLDPRVTFGAFAQAVENDRPHRRMLLAICNGAVPDDYGTYPSYTNSAYDSYAFAPEIASSWRTGPDIGVPGYVAYDQVLRNLELDARHPEAAGAGHWNDPDYIVPQEGMTASESRAQLTMWAILAAPLMVSANLATLSRQSVAMLENRELIAISQDPLGIQGREVAQRGPVTAWVKPLAGGAQALALLNPTLASRTVSVNRPMIGLRARLLRVGDVWRGWTKNFGRSVRVRVPGDGAVLLRIAR